MNDEQVINMMYESILAYIGNQDKKRKHPSRELYQAFIEHLMIFKAGIEEIEKISGGADEPKK
jgi:hypothetical protein